MSRRGLLAAAGGVLGAAALVAADQALGQAEPAAADTGAVAFYGLHQAGITTPRPGYTRFAAFDLSVPDRSGLERLLRTWTDVAADLTAGRSAASGADDGEVDGLGPARLTVNFGFGPSMFGVRTPDRFGLARQLPVPFGLLPSFAGDAIADQDNGGDMTVHVCCEDPQVAFHAMRRLEKAAAGMAAVRWQQSGFGSAPEGSLGARNLMGFHDGTANPSSAADLGTFVWVGEEGPEWMTGGTYMVVRRIRIDLDSWDAVAVTDQEAVIGRRKLSGAPLGRATSADSLGLLSTGADGKPLVPADAHVRLASPTANWGARMLRRSFAYDNGPLAGTSPAAHDVGTLFVCYQRYPLVTFVQIFKNLAGHDALSRFTVHTASAISALPAGPSGPGDWIGRRLLEA